MLEYIKYFNDHYASAVQALTPFIIGFISWMYFKLYREAKLEEGDAALNVKPKFWSFGKQYKIMAVHQYEESDDISGYKHIGQNSRPDQWKKLIKIEPSMLGLRYKIVPIKKESILTVVISRNGKEKWKLINFNK